MAEFAAITLIILILPSAFLFVLENYLGSDRQTAAVTTQSMEPIYHGYVERKGSPDFIDIHNGDLLLIQEKTPENIQVGDVIIFDHPYEDIRVVHRVIDIKIDGNGKYYFKTKGDNPTTFNIYPDPWGWISADSIYGVVVFRIPFFGWLVLEVQKEFSRWIIILLAITLLIISFRESNEAIEEISEKNNEKESKKVKIDSILTIIKSKIILFVRSRKIMVIGLIVGIICLSFLSNLRVSFTPCRITLLDVKETDIIDPDDQWDGTNNEKWNPMASSTISHPLRLKPITP
jgi:signal peptidase